MRNACAVLLIAALLAGCAAAPRQPSSSLPMSVIVNDPGARAATRAEPLKGVTSPGGAQRPIVVDEPPLHDEFVSVLTYASVFERIRAGYRIGDVEHPWVSVEYDWYAAHPAYLDRVFARSSRYLHFIVGELDRRGMPLELALLPVVESAYNPFAYSRSRAAGLWQFIAPTGQRFALKQNWWQDQRRDVIESTRAALDYLQYLHGVFGGDWLLAVAAYNYGSLNVLRAIEQNRIAGRPTDFFSLPLPAETRAYVPKLIAISRLVGNPGAAGIELPPIADAPYFRSVPTGGAIDLRLAAELSGLPIEELHALNPAFHRWATDPGGPHRLLVPVAVAGQFESALAGLSDSERLRLVGHRVARGESATAIARHHGLSPAALAQINGVSAMDVRAGDEVWVPDPGVRPLRVGLYTQAGDPPSARNRRTPPRKVHVVRKGDTLSAVAKRHGMTTAQLSKLNGLSPGALLRPGQRLVVSGEARTAVTSQTTRLAREAAAAPPPPLAPPVAPVADTAAPPVATVADAAPPPVARAAAPPVPAEPVSRTVRYTVQQGDTLYSIARRFEVTVGQLQAWNGLRGSGLRTGQTLTVQLDGGKNYGG